VEDALAAKSTRIANTSLERFKELYEIYNKEKNPNAIIFHSDIMPPKEITSRVLELVK
jgi:hypothetical protein